MELVLALVARGVGQAARGGLEAAVADVALRGLLHAHVHRLRPDLQRVQQRAVLTNNINLGLIRSTISLCYYLVKFSHPLIYIQKLNSIIGTKSMTLLKIGLCT